MQIAELIGDVGLELLQQRLAGRPTRVCCMASGALESSKGVLVIHRNHGELSGVSSAASQRLCRYVHRLRAAELARGLKKEDTLVLGALCAHCGILEDASES